MASELLREYLRQKRKENEGLEPPGIEEAQDLNRFQRIAGAVLGPVLRVPGVEKTLTAAAAPAEVIAGGIAAQIKAGVDDMDRGGNRLGEISKSLLTGLAVGATGGVASPLDFGPFRERKEQIREVLGIDEANRNVMDLFRASRTFQRERDSLFTGEKLLSEMLLDPLNFILPGVGRAAGVARLVPRASKARGAIRAVPTAMEWRRRTKQVKRMEQAEKRAQQAQISAARRASHVGRIANFATEAELSQALTRNAMRRVATSVVKSPFGKIPGVRQLITVLGGRSATLDLAGQGDAVAIEKLKRELGLEQMDRVVMSDTFVLRVDEATKPFGEIIYKDGNPYVSAKRRIEPGGKAIPEGIDPLPKRLYGADEPTFSPNTMTLSDTALTRAVTVQPKIMDTFLDYTGPNPTGSLDDLGDMMENAQRIQVERGAPLDWQYQASIRAQLRAQFGDTITVYRGVSGRQSGELYTNVSVSESVAQQFMGQKVPQTMVGIPGISGTALARLWGKGSGGHIKTYTIDIDDVVGIGHHNEGELIIRRAVLEAKEQQLVQVGISPATGDLQRITPFFSAGSRVMHEEAKKLLKSGTPADVARGEEIYREIVEDARVYMVNKLESAGYADIVVEPNYGRFFESEPSLFVQARVSTADSDDFIRNIAEIADVDFAQSSVLLHAPVHGDMPLGVYKGKIENLGDVLTEAGVPPKGIQGETAAEIVGEMSVQRRVRLRGEQRISELGRKGVDEKVNGVTGADFEKRVPAAQKAGATYSIEPSMRIWPGLTPEQLIRWQSGDINVDASFRVLSGQDFELIGTVIDDINAEKVLIGGYAALPGNKGIDLFNVSAYGDPDDFAEGMERLLNDKRLEGLFGGDRGHAFTPGLKRVTHIGSDGDDGLIGYNQLRRADDPAKAQIKGRSPEGLTDDQKSVLAQQHYDDMLRDTLEDVEVPLQDFMERAQGRLNLELSPQAIGFRNRGLSHVEAYHNEMIKAGVDINTIEDFAPGEGFFPRFVAMIREMETLKNTGGKVGVLQSIQRSRFHEMAAEAIDNGVKFTGEGLTSPISDIVELYGKAAARTIADKRLKDFMVKRGTSINQRKNSQVAGIAKLAISKFNRSANALQSFKVGAAGGRIKGGNLGAIRRLDPELADEIVVANNLKDAAERTAALKALTKKVADVQENARLDKLAAQKSSKHASDAVRHPPGLQSIDEPAFSGLLFSPEDVKAYMNTLPSEVRGIAERGVGVAAELSSFARTFQLGLDFGFHLIQGAMVLTRSPRIWGQSVKYSIATMFRNSNYRAAYLSSPKVQRIIQRYGNLIHIDSEMFEAFSKEAVLPRVLKSERIPLGAGKPVMSLLRRFADSFEMAFDVARLEMADSFDYLVELGEASIDDVAAHVNKVTGVTSSRALGISATQRQIESTAFFLAPRYTRAITGLFIDAAQGGFRGDQARKSLRNFFGATVMAYTGIAMATGQEPKLDPRSKDQGGDGGEFMTLDIAGQKVGLGSKPYSVARALVKMASDPANAGREATRWLRSQSAPVSGLAWDVITGKNFLGQPIDTPVQILRDGMLSRVMPFYAEAWAFDEPRPNGVGVAADFVGFRSWPSQPSDWRNDLRDDLAALIPVGRLRGRQNQEMLNEGLDSPTWAILNARQKQQIIQGKTGIPEIDSQRDKLEKITNQAIKQVRERGDKDVNEYYQQSEDARVEWEIRSKELHDGIGIEYSPNEFRNNMRVVNTRYSTLAEEIHDENGIHARAIEKIDEWKGEPDFVPDVDLAREEYMTQIVGNKDLTGQYGEYLFDKRDRIMEKLNRKWGGDVMKEAVEISHNSKEMPTYWRKWITDREVLRPFWGIRDQYLETNPVARNLHNQLESARNRVDLAEVKRIESNPIVRRMEKEITRRRIKMREMDPYMDALYVFWSDYTKTSRTREAEIILGRLQRDLQQTIRENRKARLSLTT